MSKPLHYKSKAPLTSWASQISNTLPQAALLALLAGTFTLGGSPRGDIEFAAIISAMAAFCLGLALVTLKWRHLRGFAIPVALALAAVILAALQMIPLPPDVWQSLPGRGLIAEIDRAAGLGAVWRPLSMTPAETISAALHGLVPLSVLLLAVQLQPNQQVRLVLVALGFGVISALTGLLQLLGDPQGALYLHASTNNGSAVGLFANRNHQAVMLACLVPLAFAAAQLRWDEKAPPVPADQIGYTRRQNRSRGIEWRMPLAIAAACVLVPLALITGSRSGLMMTVLALVTLPFVMTQRTDQKRYAPVANSSWLAIAALFVVAIAGAAIWLGRDLALDRLFASTPADDLRMQMLPTILDLAKTHWAWGTGLGSFERLYQVHEPARLLLPQYVNHAHNDWLEVIVTGGLPAVTLLAVGLISIASRAWHTVSRAGADAVLPLRRAALVCMTILGLASLSDYPLRTPFLAGFFTLCAVWLFMPSPGGRPGEVPTSSLQGA